MVSQPQAPIQPRTAIQPGTPSKTRSLIAGILCLALISPLAAQRRREQRGPRALAVLEVPAKGSPRLVPICIDVDGHFYDAGLYHASPRPLSLDAGTVYEAERSGDSVGLFTVGGASEMNGVWVGYGNWRPHDMMMASSSKPAKPAAKTSPSFDEDRPILKRRGSQSETTPSSTPEASSSPTEAKPESKPAPGSSSAPEQPKAESKASSPSTSDESDQDSGRPVLRRGKPGEEQIAPDTLPAGHVPPPSFPNMKPTGSSAPATGGSPTTESAAATGLVQIYPAISDAHDEQLRSYTYELRPDERRQYEQKLSEIAGQELAAYLKQHPGPRPAKSPLQQDGPLYAFDPNWSNEPTFVFSAKQSSDRPGVEFYITVAAHNDLYGQLHKLFTSITTTVRLSITPRLQVIDMVDANGDERGDLLFRQLWDDHTSYIVYSVGMDKLEQLFQGAEIKTATFAHP
jgi:hypothetical protein